VYQAQVSSLDFSPDFTVTTNPDFPGQAFIALAGLPPLTVLDHTTFTSDYTFTFTTEASAVAGTPCVTSGSIPGAKSIVFVDFFSPRIEPNGVVLQTHLVVLVRHAVVANTDSVRVGKWANPDYDSTTVGTPARANDDQSFPLRLAFQDTLPSSTESYTYRVCAYSSDAAGGTIHAGAGFTGGLSPGFIRVVG
jgi:hypothetical protein